MASAFVTRLLKLGFSLSGPRCWHALTQRVAPAIEHRTLIRSVETDRILDVGANRGQFTLLCRTLRPELPVVAFEPLPSEAAVFRRIHGGDQNVRLVETALGEAAGTATIHLSRSRDSSSLLPIGRAQQEMFPGTDEVGTIAVPVSRLDDLDLGPGSFQQMLLKIDVQGFELHVLRGAPRTLTSCRYVYVECSHVALYVGQALYEDVASLLAQTGFRMVASANESRLNGKLIQADYLFERSSSAGRI
jgi:FkbM family methyltransferase